MSITRRGVKFKSKNSRTRLWWGALFLIEGVLSVFVYLSLAAQIIWPDSSRAAAGVASVLSYEGRLTDASGNSLGGTGTDYCFKFAIYDDLDVDSPEVKLWPAGAPTGQSITVIDGVFNALIGTADTLDYNFYTNDTVYLNVEAATKVGGSCTNGDETYETLRSRQRIAATGYAISAANVYSTLLKTDIDNGKVQIGTGTGGASQKFLALDVKNISDTVGGACTTSGTLWYNSSNTRALVCDNGTIQEIGNLSTIVGFKEASAASAISSGTVVFSGINGISISQNAQTLSISGLNAFGVSNIGNTAGNTGAQTGTIVFSGENGITLSQITGAGGVHTLGISAGGGGETRTISNFAWPSGIALTSMAQAQGSISFGSFRLEDGNFLTATRAAILALGSIASNSSGALSISIGLYTLNGATLSLITASSGSQTYSYTSNASSAVSGLRRISVPLNMSMTPGQYYYGIRMSTANAGSFSIARGLGVTVAFSGNLGVASAIGRQLLYGVGVSSSSNLADSMAVSDIRGGGTAGFSGAPWILFTNLDIN